MYHGGEPFVYANFGGFTCSVCAPKQMTAAEIETFVTTKLGPAKGYSDGAWRVFDKGKLFPHTLSTPNPCDAPDRLHWFLIAAELAEKFNRSMSNDQV